MKAHKKIKTNVNQKNNLHVQIHSAILPIAKNKCLIFYKHFTWQF